MFHILLNLWQLLVFVNVELLGFLLPATCYSTAVHLTCVSSFLCYNVFQWPFLCTYLCDDSSTVYWWDKLWDIDIAESKVKYTGNFCRYYYVSKLFSKIVLMYMVNYKNYGAFFLLLYKRSAFSKFSVIFLEMKMVSYYFNIHLFNLRKVVHLLPICWSLMIFMFKWLIHISCL